jgi:hypothetical protein
MIPEQRLREEVSYTNIDLERALKMLEVLKYTSPNNPYWPTVFTDLSNAKARLGNIITALSVPEPSLPELPAQAPAPAPLV